MRRGIAILVLLAPTAFAYVRLTDSAGGPLVRVDNTGIQFSLNNQVVPGVQSSASGSTVTVITAGSNPQQAIHAALATWNGVGAASANVHFLPLQSTSTTINSSDFQMTIAIGSTTSDLSVVGGALAVTVNASVSQPANLVNGQLLTCTSNCQYPAGGIIDSDIMINPKYTFSTIGENNTVDFQSVMTHELGHSLGANHTGLIGATMFQTVYQNNTPVERTPSTDDLAFVNSVYPSASSPVSFGTINGTVSMIGSPVNYALLTLTDTGSGNAIGGLAGADGTFSIQVPPGSYQVYAEPLTGVVKIANLYLSANVSSFQAALLSAPVSVTANSTATANISVASGSSSLGIPFLGLTTANGSVGGLNFYPGGPVLVPSGQSVDLLLAGTGFDGSLSTSNFNVLGHGITVGAVRLDPGGATISGSPILRVTLTLAAQQSPSLASIFVTKGSSTLTLSGALVIGPPTPVTTPASMVSAASLSGNGIVSPGGIYAFFDTPANLNLGPAVPLGNSGYDPYNFLTATLDGVTVTFDGVPAPLFFVWGNQINLQVPFEVANKKTTNVVVSYLGSASAAIPVSVSAAEPAIFATCLEGGVEVACIVNQTADATGNYINGPTSPASPGTTITVFGTGVGVLPSSGYALQTGGSAPAPPISANGYTCTIGGVNAPVAFAGWTYTAVGLAQWNVQIPSTLTATGKLPIVCTNGTQSTQSGVDVYVN